MYIYIVFKAKCFAIDIWKLLRNNPLGHRIAGFFLTKLHPSRASHIQKQFRITPLLLLHFSETFWRLANRAGTLQDLFFAVAKVAAAVPLALGKSESYQVHINERNWTDIVCADSIFVFFLRDRHYYIFFQPFPIQYLLFLLHSFIWV